MRLRDEGGQALVLLVVFVAAVLVAFAMVVGTAHRYDVRGEVQKAADAAALAGAQHAVVTEKRDARGIVYCASVAVDPDAGPAAAKAVWSANIRSIPGYRADRVAVLVDGDVLTVVGEVDVAPQGIVREDGVVTVTVTATAREGQSSEGPPCQ